MPATNHLNAAVDDERVVSAIAAALKDLQFGAVEITLHNGQVVHIERKEKLRFQPSTKAS